MNTTPKDKSADKADHDHTLKTDHSRERKKALEKLRNSALFSLTRRDHSAYELKQKLTNKGYPTEDIENLIPRLIETGLLDDKRFAENYISYRGRRGYGPNRLRMELQTKGVEDSVIAELIEITDNAWFSEARKIWRKQFKGKMPENGNERAKQTRYLYNRGFTQDHISQVFKQNDEDNE